MEDTKMVHADWIERKLTQLEQDRCRNHWTEIRERQLTYLRELYASGVFNEQSAETIDKQLVSIFHGCE
jgi:hypothetical protein